MAFGVLVGPRTPLTTLSIRIVRIAFQVAGLKLGVVAANSIEGVRQNWTAQSGGDAVLLYSERPEAELVEWLSQASVRPIVVLPAVRSIAAALRQAENISFDLSIRRATLPYAILHDLARSPAALVLSDPHLDWPVGTLASEILSVFNCPLSTDQLAAIIKRLGATAEIEPSVRAVLEGARPASADAPAPAEAWPLVQAIEAQYEQVLAGRELTALAWDPALFNYPQRRGTPVLRPGEVDLTGPSGAIVFGPYLHLPRGQWSLAAAFRTQEIASGVSLRADVRAGRLLAEGRFELTTDGRYGFRLDFVIADPRVPVEFRLHRHRSSIEGLLTLESVQLHRTTLVTKW